MKLYTKKLNNIHELNAEKAILKARMGQIDPNGTFSLKVDSKAKIVVDEKKSAPDDLLQSVLKLDKLGIFLKLLPLITDSRNKKKVVVEEKQGPSLLVKAGIEFVGGYLKWKAIELTYKGLKKLITSNKNKEA